MKRSKKLLLFLLGVIMCLAVAVCAACSSETTITITFDTDGGSEVEAVTLTGGGTLEELPTTTKDGYNFAGWYYTEDDTEVEYTLGTVLSVDITLTAKWEKSYDLALSYQNMAVAEIGDYFRCEFEYGGNINSYSIEIEKDDTAYTLDDAKTAGLVSYATAKVNTYSSYYSYIYGYIMFAAAGDYNIYAYANGDVASTCVSVESSSSFTGNSISLDHIEYLGTSYNSGSEITLYDIDGYVYLYFNAPETCDSRTTYTYTYTYYEEGEEKTTTKTVLMSSAYSEYSDSDDQYYVYIWESSLSEDITYTVKVSAPGYSAVTVTFTVKYGEVSGDSILTTPEDVEAYLYNYFDISYYIASESYYTYEYTLTDSDGNVVERLTYNEEGEYYENNYDLWAGMSYYGDNIYRFYLNGYIYTAGDYKLTVTLYDYEGSEITALTQTINITVSEYGGSSYWSLDTESTDYDEDYPNYYFTDTAKTFTYVYGEEMKKVIVNGVNIPIGGSATVEVSGISLTVSCKKSGGSTYLTVSVPAISDDLAFGIDDSLYIYIVCATTENDNYHSSRSINVVGPAYAEYCKTLLNSYKYSLEKYFADYIVADGDYYELYTAINTALSASSYKDLIVSMSDFNVYDVYGYDVYDYTTDYVGTWLSALDSKTTLPDSLLESYAYAYGCSNLILAGSSVYSDYSIFWMGVSEYLLIETSDKEICEYFYDYFVDDLAYYADMFGDYYTNMVTAHDSGTDAEFIDAVVNLYYYYYYGV